MNYTVALKLPEVFGTLRGIYLITCAKSGALYVGQTSSNFLQRWTEHIRLLRKGRHHNVALQAAYKQYGVNSLGFMVVEAAPGNLCKKELKRWLDEREHFHIRRYGSANQRR